MDCNTSRRPSRARSQWTPASFIQSVAQSAALWEKHSLLLAEKDSSQSVAQCSQSTALWEKRSLAEKDISYWRLGGDI